jgi:hypothetical protein
MNHLLLLVVYLKKRNKRVFDQEECSHLQVVQHIKDILASYRAAHFI